MEILRETLDKPVQILPAGIRADDDSTLLVRAQDGDRPRFIFELRHIRHADDARLPFDRDRRQVTYPIRLSALEINMDIRVIAVILRIIRQDACACAADRGRQRVIERADRDAVVFQFLTVRDEGNLRQPLLIRTADIRHAVGTARQHLLRHLGGTDEISHVIAA